jgi:hypothetical protein
MRRVFGDAVISVFALLALLVMLVALDPRVRHVASSMWGSDTAAVTSAGKELGEMSELLLSALRDQGLTNAPLMVFALAATVLVLFMLRT